MYSTTAIAQALRSNLPAELQPYVPRLATLLAGTLADAETTDDLPLLAILRALTAKAPVNQSVAARNHAQIRDVLQFSIGQLILIRSAGADPEPYPDMHPESPFLIGHREEYDTLCAAYNTSVKNKHPWASFITSQAGYGRGALVRAVAQYAHAQGAKVLVACFTPNDRLPAYEVERLYTQVQTALHPDAFDNPTTELRHIAADVLNFGKTVRIEAANRPTVVVLENLQYAPVEWYDALSDTIRSFGNYPVLCLGTIETPCPLAEVDEATLSEPHKVLWHHVQQLTADQWAELRWLPPISVHDVAAFLGPHADDLAARLYTYAAGVPVNIASLWNEWARSEALLRDGHGWWRINPARADLITAAPSQRAAALLRRQLPADAPFSIEQIEHMLEYAALEGYVWTADAVAHALDVDADDLIDFIDDYLLEVQDGPSLLRWVGHEVLPEIDLNLYAFSSPHWQQVWTTRIAPAMRQTMQRRLAASLEEVYGGGHERVLNRLMALFAATEQTEKLAYYRPRQQFAQDIETLRWQVGLLALQTPDDFVLHRRYAAQIDLSWKLIEAGKYAEAEHYARAALASARAIPSRADEANALRTVGYTLHQQGDYQQARPLLRQALSLSKLATGPCSLLTAASLGTLAWLLRDTGKRGAARPLLERALAIHEQRLGPTHPDTATSLNNLAGLLQAQGNYAAARPLYERALAIYEQQRGPTHPDTATSLNNLALLLDSIGDYAAARPLYERALAIREQRLGPTHPDTATSLNNLALLLQAQGDYAAARPLHERALAIREQQLGPHHPDVALSLNNLAALYYAQGDYGAARPLMERALAIREQQLGPTHPSTATSLNNLAGLLQAQGDDAAARPLYERAQAIREQQLGPTHPDTAQSLNNLAGLMESIGDYAAARPLYERALAITEQQLGPDHPDVATSLNNLAVLLDDMGDYAAARPLLERALAIVEQQLGPTHPDTATSLNSLAALYYAQKEYAAARPLYERALAIREQRLGPTHANTATSLHFLAHVYEKQNDLATAAALMERALAIQHQVLGDSHDATRRTLVCLGRIKQQMNGDDS